MDMGKDKFMALMTVENGIITRIKDDHITNNLNITGWEQLSA